MMFSSISLVYAFWVLRRVLDGVFNPSFVGRVGMKWWGLERICKASQIAYIRHTFKNSFKNISLLFSIIPFFIVQNREWSQRVLHKSWFGRVFTCISLHEVLDTSHGHGVRLNLSQLQEFSGVSIPCFDAQSFLTIFLIPPARFICKRYKHNGTYKNKNQSVK